LGKVNQSAALRDQVEHPQRGKRAITLGRHPDGHPSLTDLGF
jgi:hypothetical protein